MKTNLLLVGSLFFLTLVVNAQELKIDALKMISSPTNPGFGSMIWASGNSITKLKIAIPFQEEMIHDSVMVGYKYQKTALESISENDVVLLFIPKLKYTSSMQGMTKKSYDESGKKVFAISELNGAWKELTITNKYKERDNLVLVFTENIKLSDDSMVNTASFKSNGVYYSINKLYKTK